MVEAALALGLLVGGLALAALPPHVGMWGGVVVASVALGLGIVASTLYHLRLRAVLGPRGLLPPRWWVHPLPLHSLLDDHPRQRKWVLAPFYLGVGCAAVCLGGAVMGSVFALRSVL
jgi:hypothetical protein